MELRDRLSNFLDSVIFWNPELNRHELVRDMLNPKGVTYRRPGTISQVDLVTIKDPPSKREVLRLTAHNLISQNPSRARRNNKN